MHDRETKYKSERDFIPSTIKRKVFTFKHTQNY